jgi:hypothetical protein
MVISSMVRKLDGWRAAGELAEPPLPRYSIYIQRGNSPSRPAP